ncbi:unnamed protein product [Clonostachys rosea f. rosea IK726]|uniref:Enoyl reductase (ER) domain-containing protein n=2 Tax=Bionectria ochroleuca TaxID=29856 RepID=A0A8H7K316_BIOOC|nr:unnamed protein product [Clonostachys rosea f. rosea IK726]
MKEALVAPGVKVTIHDVPMPQISDPRQILIQVIVSGSNPKDWKVPYIIKTAFNQGDDIAGFVHAVGDEVTEFKVGDRVGAFHEMITPAGSFAEYAIAWEWSTFHIPKNTSFEEAATIPLAAMTSTLGLYQNLALPTPWNKAEEPIPLVVYGAASAVGAFAVKLARLSNIHPLICVAGRGTAYVESLIDKTKGDTVIDYRKGDDAVIEGMKRALGGKTLLHAFDAVSEKGSYVNISKVLTHNGGKLTVVLPGKSYDELPETIEWKTTSVGRVHNEEGLESGSRQLAYAFYRLLSNGLKEGWFTPHPHEVIPGGLSGIETGLKNLKGGKASAVKYVFRIAETPGLAKASL